MLERAYAATTALMRRSPDTLSRGEVFFNLGAPEHQLRLRRRLEPLWRARDGMARAASRKPVQTDAASTNIQKGL